MIRALLAGTKTQTRRVVKDTGLYAIDAAVHGQETAARELLALASRCPYGQPGDQLWVREAFSGSIAYERHGYPLREWGNKIWFWADGNPQRGDWTKPRPSIHMPRHLSRITLELTEVRVERLQAISEADARAEGFELGAPPCIDAPLRWYRHLWDQINGAGAWDANPWVWVVEFQRVTP
jgi:hypothetical protein